MKMDRLISIIMLLLERKTVSAPELARTFEVSTRTIYRDIDTIAQAGIPIVTTAGLHGGVRIMEEYKVDKRLFTTSDITSLLIGLGGAHSALSGGEIGQTLSKIRGMIPTEQLQEAELQAGQIAIDLTPWIQDSRLEKHLALIKQSLTEKRVLSFGYASASGTQIVREVEPYRLLHKADSWYLQGYCRLRHDFRTFRLARMQEICLAAEGFVPRPFNPAQLEQIGGSAATTVEATLRFDEFAKSEIISFFGDGVIEADGEGQYLARVQLYDTPRAYYVLLVCGEHIECLHPPHIRAYVRECVMAMAKMYEPAE